MEPTKTPPMTSDADFEALLIFLKQERGFDFTGYKRSSLMRRITKRMQTISVESFPAYIEYLTKHPSEFIYLFDTILINVTTFFRDPDMWSQLREQVLPALIKAKGHNEHIRIWCAACASGEETYSVAMELAELVGADQYRDRVKIYGTDIDGEALTQARQAYYSPREVADVPPDMLEKYFESSNGRYQFRKDLRRSIIFGRHDLMQDAPISRIDLLLCRNALMYFNTESQARILSRFHFSLRDTGILVMGKAEMLYMHSKLFVPADLKRRIFKKVPHVPQRETKMLAQAEERENAERQAEHIRMREAAFDAGVEAQCAVDLQGCIVMMNDRARSLLGLTLLDIGRPLREFSFANRIVDLKGKIQDAYVELQSSTIKDVSWATDAGDVRMLDVHITPLKDPVSSAALGISIAFRDHTVTKRLQERLEQTHQELETAYEELQSANEELETTNEELQSTNEELETTNEELQSTNEELETINEELHSTNEELQTVNFEFRGRSAELNRLNDMLGSILASMRGGVIVVDQDLRVILWSRAAEELWGLRSSEVLDKNLLNLDMGLPVEQLIQPIRRCLVGESDYQTIVLDAVNRRGRTFRCKVICSALRNHETLDVEGVIVLTEEGDKST